MKREDQVSHSRWLTRSLVVATACGLLSFVSACANDAATPDKATQEPVPAAAKEQAAKEQPAVEVPAAKSKYAERIKKLTPLQYKVTQDNGTERPFNNEFWDNKEAGLYLDVVSGEPLFASVHKFKSGTGWPSFTQPLVKRNVVEVSDTTHGMVRVEVRSKNADSHLGHVFTDGPKPGGLRYCINSASLEFVPVSQLEERGLGEYLELFGRMEPKKK